MMRIAPAARLGLGQLCKLRPEVFQRGRESRQALPFLRDHLGGRARDETGVGELALGLGDFGFEAGNFLLQALALGRLVDFDFQHQPEVADHGNRCIGGGQRIHHMHFGKLGDNTTSELRAALSDLMAQNPKGLVIDLRNNGGGYLQTAVEVASEFINNGVVLYEQYGDGKRTDYSVLKNGQATDIPLVVLINEGTASASEIVAGAIQDYGRGKLVGVTSYGKGSVQNWVPLSNDQGAVRVTIAKWLTPDERTIQGTGLTPDVEVEITNEDRQAGQDPQLDKAIEVLLQEINGSASQ